MRGGATNNFGAGGRLGVSSAADEEDEEPRTGWLHNTEPKYFTPAYAAASEDGSSLAMRRLLVQKMNDYRNHRIVAPPAIHPCGDRRVAVTEHRISVPLYHPDLESAASSPSDSVVPLESAVSGFFGNDSFDRPTVDVYFSIVEVVSNSSDDLFFASLSDPAIDPRRRASLYLRRGSGGESGIDPSRAMIYLQGGPGFGCAAPVSGLGLASSKSSWAATALFGDITNLDGKAFERVVLMDQRGTGRSSPITRQRLRRMFPDLFLLDDDDSAGGESAQLQLAQAKVDRAVSDATEYLSRFRADSIVRDAEWIREALVHPSPSVDEDAVEVGPPQPWGAALGQSFGGFCLMTYLSSISRPPGMCLFTGGIAPMDTPAGEVYDRLWHRVRERSLKYYEQYPGDVALVKRIVRHLLLREEDPSQPTARLPSGGVLTARRFLQLGLGLGGSPGSSFANLHSVIGSAFLDDDSDNGEGDEELSVSFLRRMDREQSFDDAPLYFLLHESIYADGPSSGATDWAAHSSYERLVGADPKFDYRATSSTNDDEAPTLFFGEMVFPWMAHGDFAEVSGRGMCALSEALAAKEDWAPLFDASNMRAALGGIGDGGLPRSKAASATYYDDMYVDFDCVMKLVRRGGPLEKVKVWISNEYQHSGLRDDGASIVSKLVGMAKGNIHVPS